MTYFDEYATMEVNKETYKKLSLKWHPDRPGGNENTMKDINAQWDLAKKNYALGAWPRRKPEPAGASAWGGVFSETTEPSKPETRYTYEVKGRYQSRHLNKKYTGTCDEIYMQVLTELGPHAAIDFLIKVNTKTDTTLNNKPQSSEEMWGDFLKNLFK